MLAANVSDFFASRVDENFTISERLPNIDTTPFLIFCSEIPVVLRPLRFGWLIVRLRLDDADRFDIN